MSCHKETQIFYLTLFFALKQKKHHTICNDDFKRKSALSQHYDREEYQETKNVMITETDFKFQFFYFLMFFREEETCAVEWW